MLGDQSMEKFIPFALIFGFPIMWCVVCLLLSHIGGWATLSDVYRDDANTAGEAHYMRSGEIGIVNYSSCLTLRVSDAGLRLSVMLPFRVGHPPIFIPWTDFHDVAENRVMFMFPFLNATIGDPPLAHLMLPLWVRDHLPRGVAPH